VDCLEGHEMRHTPSRSGTSSKLRHDHDESPSRTRKREVSRDNDQNKKPMTNAEASYFVDHASKAELRAMGDDLAIVAPLVDGRMKDEAASEQ